MSKDMIFSLSFDIQKDIILVINKHSNHGKITVVKTQKVNIAPPRLSSPFAQLMPCNTKLIKI
jgi:hypothetical protein